MSSRITIALAQHEQTWMHLYREIHDDLIHLEITLDPTNIRLNLVIPGRLVEGVTAILSRLETKT